MYADVGGFACEDTCVRLHLRNIANFKDRVGGADHIIKTCRHPFVEHCEDVLQMGIFLIIRVYCYDFHCYRCDAD